MSNNDLKLRVLFNMVDNVTRPLRRLINGNQDLAQSVKQSRERLRELSRTQRDIDGFTAMKRTTQASADELTRAQARVKALADALHNSGPPTRAMTQELEQARAAAAQLHTTHRANVVELHSIRRALTGAGVDTRNLAQHERTLRQDIAATTDTMRRQQTQLDELTARTRRLGEARGRMQRMQEVSGRIAGTGTTMMAAGTATGALVAAPTVAYAQAEDSATQLKVAMMETGKVVPETYAKINALAMKLGDRLPGTTADFQDMMTMLTRQGISAQSVLGGMGEATAYLGVMLKKAPADAAEFAAKLQDATRTTEGDMMSLMDVIQRSYYLGVDDNNMLQGFAKLSPAMDTIKQKGLEGAKALAPLLVMADQAGMKGEAAGNALRKVLQMSLDDKKIAKVNKELAPAQRLDFTDGKGEFGGLEKMYKQFDKLSGLSTQKRLHILKEAYGDDAETLQIISLLMEKGAAGYAEVQAKMARQADLQTRVNEQLGTLKNLWESATGTATNAMVAMGETIAPELKSLTQWLGDVAQRTGTWARENPRLAGAMMKTAAVLAVVLTVGGALLLMLASVLGPLAMVRFGLAALGMQGGLFATAFGGAATAVRAVAGAVMFLGRMMLMNPIGLLITGIAVGAYLIYRNWEPIKGFFGGLWDRITTTFSGGISGIAALILNWSPMGLFYRAFAGLMGWMGIELPATFTGFGANILSGLVNGITGGMGRVRDAITGLGESTIGWFKEKLGIHSPSRVFGELGGWIGEGAAIGIEGKHDKVAKAASILAAVATTSFTLPAGAALADQVNIATPPAITAPATALPPVVPRLAQQVAPATAAPAAPPLVQPIPSPSMAPAPAIVPLVAPPLATAPTLPAPAVDPAPVRLLPQLDASALARQAIAHVPARVARTGAAAADLVNVLVQPKLDAAAALRQVAGMAPAKAAHQVRAAADTADLLVQPQLDGGAIARTLANLVPARQAKMADKAAAVVRNVLPPAANHAKGMLPPVLVPAAPSAPAADLVASAASLRDQGDATDTGPRWPQDDEQPVLNRARPVINIDTRPPVQSRQAQAAPVVHNTYQITINPAPGMDPQEIARAVGLEMDKRERAAQSRRTSRLSD